jgi:hypothetical protein
MRFPNTARVPPKPSIRMIFLNIAQCHVHIRGCKAGGLLVVDERSEYLHVTVEHLYVLVEFICAFMSLSIPT